MHPTNPKPAATLWDELRGLLAFELANGGQISFVNRLDRETSGIVLVAKKRPAARELTMAMKAGLFQKTYHALVWGWPDWEELEVDQRILRAGSVVVSPIHLKQMIHPDGAVAFTRLRVVARAERACGMEGRFSLVEATPRTGRTHQIRVHLAFTGHPIVGDKIYGPSERCYLQFIETGWTEELRRILILPNHALHASALSWDKMQWTSPLPELFNIGA